MLLIQTYSHIFNCYGKNKMQIKNETKKLVFKVLKLLKINLMLALLIIYTNEKFEVQDI